MLILNYLNEVKVRLSNMTNAEKIIKIANENNGYVTTKQVKNININTIELSRLVKQNKLERITRGYYAITNSFCDDYYKYQLKSKNCVFSHSTALYFYDLSDRTPLYFDITVPIGYNGSLSKDKNIKLHYVKKELLKLGLTTVVSPFGMELRIYDLERTICDIVKYRNHMDKEIFAKTLKCYVKREDKDLIKLMKYAKKLNIDKKILEYMEVLL